MASPSPVPWEMSETFAGDGTILALALTGATIDIVADCTTDLQMHPDRAKANAELIVRAVNSHAELLAALKEIDGLYRSLLFQQSHFPEAFVEKALDRAASALANAEGVSHGES